MKYCISQWISWGIRHIEYIPSSILEPTREWRGGARQGADRLCLWLSQIHFFAGNILSLSIPAFLYFLTFKPFHLSIAAIEGRDNLREISIKMLVVQSNVFKKNIGKNIVILKLTVVVRFIKICHWDVSI